jgi:triosephosphate isomerase (TIM)
MKTYLIAGNWKMNTVLAEAQVLASTIAQSAHTLAENVTLAVCPPAVYAHAVIREIEQYSATSRIGVGVQNCHHADKGAYTGDISARMAKDIGCHYVITGHSERRQFSGETDTLINKKNHAVLAQGLSAIYCIGETLQERQADQTFAVVKTQIAGGLQDITAEQTHHIVIAYEPVWAIGTGLAATAEQAQEVHAFIRTELQALYGDAAHTIKILYGGSMNAENAQSLLSQPDIDGGLIGGASLKAESFLAIARSAV